MKVTIENFPNDVEKIDKKVFDSFPENLKKETGTTLNEPGTYNITWSKYLDVSDEKYLQALVDKINDHLGKVVNNSKPKSAKPVKSKITKPKSITPAKSKTIKPLPTKHAKPTPVELIDKIIPKVKAKSKGKTEAEKQNAVLAKKVILIETLEKEIKDLKKLVMDNSKFKEKLANELKVHLNKQGLAGKTEDIDAKIKMLKAKKKLYSNILSGDKADFKAIGKKIGLDYRKVSVKR